MWLLIAAIAVSLAYWTWRLAPLPAGDGAARSVPASMSGVEALPAQNWFAIAGSGKAASSGRYSLRWLYPGRPGVCILAMPGLQDKTFRIGDEVEPGVKLKEVGKDYVLLEGRAGAGRIDLPVRQEPTRPAAIVPQIPTVDPTVGNR
ncbi:MAG: hypothetical protein COS39_00405 [Hydrogenophilales bacterium CG03_land_8_20_14_0_80_62_28]|nr:MAG: hypothetical protein AUJ86_07860 [Hydrogenophilaceae bacterium CG1_02_62_390]PIV24718.1 MAG: hypothetical protein COS39_00405 [Hydrogenophilales bacterium CG03_land_8_20_14_0_80_62_28]PIW38508.1 MAG: hypothetical protein COW23_06135 [Hydrogenophilales bacterium CG15_BIG_FIL_POST_REV_8_21_14_020_62_31]PIW71259.1 MAG: hypothetical protein COW07_09015 [Hydrogenophilales bacterium CG12_big_fil_rev_8_21_14_0_65_61_21]PIX02618.1 MAG: hypothetical protein COZ79_00820 [Hydrogenophilales bacteri